MSADIQDEVIYYTVHLHVNYDLVTSWDHTDLLFCEARVLCVGMFGIGGGGGGGGVWWWWWWWWCVWSELRVGCVE